MSHWNGRAVPALALFLFAVFLSLGCSGERAEEQGGSATATHEVGLISPEDLASMVLTKDELGAQYAGFSVTPKSGLLSNREAVRQTPDFLQVSTIVEQTSSGRLSGYRRLFVASQALTETDGAWLIGSSVDVYAGEEGAAEAFLDREHDTLSGDGFLQLEETQFGSYLQFDPPPVGDVWFGKTLSADSAVVAGSHTHWTTVGFRKDRVVGHVLVVSTSDVDVREEVGSLARKLEEKISKVLDGQPVEAVALTPRDVLVQAQAELERLSTVHMSQARKVQIEGNTETWTVDLDVEFPDRAVGSARLGGAGRYGVFLEGDSGYLRSSRSSSSGGTGGEWACIESFGASAAAIGLGTPDFSADVDLAGADPEPEIIAREELSGREVYVVRLELSPAEYLSGVFKLLPAVGPVPPDLMQYGTAVIDVYVGTDDFLIHRYVVDLSLEQGNQTADAIKADAAFSGFNVPLRFPDDAMPFCGEFYAPCSGPNVDSCLSPPPELQAPTLDRSACEGSERRVCLVPLGAVSPGLLDSLVAYYKRELDLEVRILPGVVLLEQFMDQERQQFDTGFLVRQVEGAATWEISSDPNVILIGITPLDMTDADQPNLNYLFGQRFGEGADFRFGVISYFRMNPETYGRSPDPLLLETRLRKMVTRFIGSLYYGLPDNTDPSSVLYESIGGLTDLDRIGEELPVPALR
jgi:predicted Zn-dependent protease